VSATVPTQHPDFAASGAPPQPPINARNPPKSQHNGPTRWSATTAGQRRLANANHTVLPLRMDAPPCRPPFQRNALISFTNSKTGRSGRPPCRPPFQHNTLISFTIPPSTACGRPPCRPPIQRNTLILPLPAPRRTRPQMHANRRNHGAIGRHGGRPQRRDNVDWQMRTTPSPPADGRTTVSATDSTQRTDFIHKFQNRT